VTPFLPEKTLKKSNQKSYILTNIGREEVFFWSLLLKKVKKNTYMYTKTYEIGGSLNSKN
jgi:hypothetical protein